MKIEELRATRITACPGGLIWAAEAMLYGEGMKKVFVTYAEDDIGEHFTVAAESVYDFLVNNLDEAPEFAEEYEEQKDAKKSVYGPVFAYLRKTARSMGEVA